MNPVKYIYIYIPFKIFFVYILLTRFLKKSLLNLSTVCRSFSSKEKFMKSTKKLLYTLWGDLHLLQPIYYTKFIKRL